MTVEDMDEIAELISLTLSSFEQEKSNIIKRVEGICSKYPLYPEY